MGGTPHTTIGAAPAAQTLSARPYLSLVTEAPAAFEPAPVAFEAEELPAADQWQDRALCAQTDPEAFFPEKGGSTREAKKICLGCEVRSECLEYALAHDERFGIWGGLSERERRRLKRGII
ncbi:WhiB family transcriptional regulator [Mycobacterium sp.]|uniref:WhiB family transcriptional regulator n=1 Tax=Mycobacterium sp. TaxID=1785 RepID=UPI003F9D8939